MRKFFVVLMALWFLSGAAAAETIHLKSGPLIEGEIVERAGSSVKLDVGGTVLTFDADEIDSVSADSPVVPAAGLVTAKNSSPGSAKHFLWKVSGPGKATIYLFGSIHLGKPGMFPLAAPIEQAFDSSDVLVVEVNLNAIDPSQASRLVLEKALYPRGDLLAYHLSVGTRVRLRNTLKRYGIAPELVQQHKPWFLAMNLTVAQIESLGFSKDYGVDQYLLNKAAPVGKAPVKDVIELETFAQQLDFLDGIQDQDMFLAYTLDSLDETEQTLPELIAAWQSGAADSLEKIFIKDIEQKNPASESIFKTILYDRNSTMTERLKSFLAGDRIYFVVVGAAHLIGPRGIVEQLRSAGFRVEQL